MYRLLESTLADRVLHLRTIFRDQGFQVDAVPERRGRHALVFKGGSEETLRLQVRQVCLDHPLVMFRVLQALGCHDHLAMSLPKALASHSPAEILPGLEQAVLLFKAMS